MRVKRPDVKNAVSIIEAAKRDMAFTLKLSVNEESGPTIIRNIHECFRMLGDGLMVSQGRVSVDHSEPLNELMKLKVDSKRPLNLLDSLRRLRNNINYYGYKPKVVEVMDAVSIAESCFDVIYKEVKRSLD